MKTLTDMGGVGGTGMEGMGSGSMGGMGCETGKTGGTDGVNGLTGLESVFLMDLHLITDISVERLGRCCGGSLEQVRTVRTEETLDSLVIL